MEEINHRGPGSKCRSSLFGLLPIMERTQWGFYSFARCSPDYQLHPLTRNRLIEWEQKEVSTHLLTCCVGEPQSIWTCPVFPRDPPIELQNLSSVENWKIRTRVSYRASSRRTLYLRSPLNKTKRKTTHNLECHSFQPCMLLKVFLKEYNWNTQ